VRFGERLHGRDREARGGGALGLHERRELRRVAHQHEHRAAQKRRDGGGQGHLPGFVHEHDVEKARFRLVGVFRRVAGFLGARSSAPPRAPPRDQGVVRRGVAGGADHGAGVRERAQLLHRARRVLRAPGAERRRRRRRLASLAAGAHEGVDADTRESLEHVVHGAVRVRGDQHGLPGVHERAYDRG
jgi:hypothetical protein